MVNGFAICLVAVFALCPKAFAEDYFKAANELYDKGEYKQAVKMYRAAIEDGRYEPFA